jgi:hypothetical protein
MQSMMPAMQGNPMMQHMMDSMKMLGGNLNQMMSQMQGMMSDKTMSQDKMKMQHMQNMNKQMQSMMQSMDGMLGEMEQMQKNK